MVETYTHDFEGDIVAVAVAGEVIEATGNHPFWVVAGGRDGRNRPEHVPETPPHARPPGRWVDAGSLRIGDMLLLRPNRRASVTRLTIRQARQTVYNFQVEGVHTYVIGTTQVLVHNKAAANNLLGNALPAKPGRMYVEDYSLLGGREPGREFVVPGRSVPEIFSARLPNGSDTLIVTGTESLGQGTLVNRLRQVQELAGGPGSFNKVTGLASDTLEQLVRSGKFDTQAAAELLGSNLGGKWTVKAVERPGQKGVFDVIAERVGK